MDVSLIIPVYNAAAFLRQSLEDIHISLCGQKSETWELLLVDDASPDRALEICREFASSPRPYAVKVLSNERNLGKGAAVRHGMLHATGKYRLFNDCDLAYPMSEILKVLEVLKSGADVAIASRGLEDSLYIFSPKDFRYLYTRHVASRFLNYLIQRLFLPKYADTQAGLKGFTAPAAEFLFSQSHLDGFSFDLELLYLATKASLMIREVPVRFYVQRVTTVDLSFEALRMFRDILRILYGNARGRYRFDAKTSQKAGLREETDHPR